MRPIKNNLYNYAVENNLAHLLKEFSDKNEFTPMEIGFDSTQEVTWCCSFGHEIIESPHQRVRRGYCPVCGKARNGSFAQNFPELLPFWSSKNKMDPYLIPPTFTGLITWQCEHGHEWTRRISLQVKLKNCPHCEQENNNFFEKRPELLEEWDYEANSDTDPKTVSVYSNKTFSWICKNGHKYEASPAALMRRSISCPTCASAGFQNPDLIAEWHPEKNGNTTPYDFSANSQKQAWFICSSCGSEYMARIAARVKRKNNKCPNCR